MSKLGTLKSNLWKVFSLYIRLRDADQWGYCECITCGKRHHYKDIDAGHFIPKSRGLSIYFMEENVNAQCRYCNSFLHGNQYLYSKAVDAKYGNGTSDRIYKKSRKFKQYTTQEYQKLIDNYKNQIKFYEFKI